MSNLTPAQKRYLQDNSQFNLDSVSPDGSLFVRTSGNSLAKVSADMITQHMNSIGLREYDYQVNPNQPSERELDRDYTRQIEPKKIENMIETIKANSLGGKQYGSVSEIQDSPELYAKLHQDYGNLVTSNGGF